MTELDRVFEELGALREQSTDVHATVARIEERLMLFMHESGDRARKASDRVQKLELATETRHEALELELSSTSKQLFAIKVWAAAAALLVPGTLAVVAWVLSRIPPDAWSAVAK